VSTVKSVRRESYENTESTEFRALRNRTFRVIPKKFECARAVWRDGDCSESPHVGLTDT